MIRPVFTKDVIILLNLFKRVLPFKKYETTVISNESESVSFRRHARLLWFKHYFIINCPWVWCGSIITSVNNALYAQVCLGAVLSALHHFLVDFEGRISAKAIHFRSPYSIHVSMNSSRVVILSL
jgi:hypothetical protein